MFSRRGRYKSVIVFSFSVMGFWFRTEEVVEGAARVLVPRLDRAEGEPLDHARSRAAVFYNPAMRLNRDTAVLVLAVQGEALGRAMEACEPMCGSGVRGVRLVLEAGAGRVIMGDLNPSAVQLAEENARRNHVSDRVKIRMMDANLLMNLHSSPMNRFDYVDIDPYGSPAQFLDSAVRCTRDGGVVALTATDMAPLCGVNPVACLRKYGGRPMRASYTHEVALRLLLGSFVRAAAVHEMGVKPLFGYYADHYVRTYLQIKQGAKPADATLAEMGYILNCPRCLRRVSVKGSYLKASRTCGACGGQMVVGGPMWLGETADGGFLGGMLAKVGSSGVAWEPRLENLMNMIRDEVGLPPAFYSLDELCSRLRISSLPLDFVLEKLRGAGFKASRTHFHERGLRTDAGVSDLESLLKA
jgi:tRNA (guanine26-N2/guanine27-N2)-dimethyltransferase